MVQPKIESTELKKVDETKLNVEMGNDELGFDIEKMLKPAMKPIVDTIESNLKLIAGVLAAWAIFDLWKKYK